MERRWKKEYWICVCLFSIHRDYWSVGAECHKLQCARCYQITDIVVGWAKMLSSSLTFAALVGAKPAKRLPSHTNGENESWKLADLLYYGTALAVKRNIKFIFDAIPVMALSLLPELTEKMTALSCHCKFSPPLSSNFTTSQHHDSSCHAKYLQ